MKQILVLLACTAAWILPGCSDPDTSNTTSTTVDTPAGEQAMLDAIAKYPDSLLLTENLLQYYREAGNYDKAIAEINKKVAKDSLNPRVWDIKATLHLEDGDTTKAIDAFAHAVAIYPDPQYIIALGTLFAGRKDPKALVMADALIAGDKAMADKEAFFIKGLYYSNIQQYEKAIPFFDKSLTLSYTFMPAYTEKALALSALNRNQEALAVMDKALTVQNNFDEGYYYRGRILEKLGRTQEAIESYQTAMAYTSDYTEARDALSRLGAKP